MNPPKKGSIRDRIINLERFKQGEYLTLTELSKELGERKESVQGTMGCLFTRGQIRRKYNEHGTMLYGTAENISSKDLITMRWV